MEGQSNCTHDRKRVYSINQSHRRHTRGIRCYTPTDHEMGAATGQIEELDNLGMDLCWIDDDRDIWTRWGRSPPPRLAVVRQRPGRKPALRQV